MSRNDIRYTKSATLLDQCTTVQNWAIELCDTKLFARYQSIAFRIIEYRINLLKRNQN